MDKEMITQTEFEEQEPNNINEEDTPLGSNSNESNEENKDEYTKYWNENVSFEDLKNLSQDRDKKETKTINDIFKDEEDTEKEEKRGWSITLTKPLKYRGKEIYPQTEDELIELAQKGLDYSFKMNKIKPYRELISFLQERNIEPSSVIKMLSTNNTHLVQTEPTMNVETQTEFNFEGHPLESVIARYLKIDKGIAQKIFSTFENIDPQFKVEIVNNALEKAFAVSVANGEFDRVYPKAVEVKKQNPFMGWIEAYKVAGKNVAEPRVVKEQNEPEIKTKKVPSKKVKKTIEEQYKEIWNDNRINSIEDLEKILMEGV